MQEGKKALDLETLKQFRAIPTQDILSTGENRHTASVVLRVVFAYLYSGQKELAYKTLKEMWPPFDQERIWKLILDMRRMGVLRYTSKQNGYPPSHTQ